MPSKNTSVISARVKDETALKFTQIAENRGITVAKLLDEIAENLEENSEPKKGVTPDGCAVCEYSDIVFRYQELELDALISIFEKRKYPEHEIKRQIRMMIDQVDCHGNYNPRKAGDEYA